MNEYIIDIEDKKKICIIGSNGYIGSRIIEFLLFRTDYLITVISNKFHDFNISNSERIVTVTGDQDEIPSIFFKYFDFIVTFAPYSSNLITKIKEDQLFIFTDPRYQHLLPEDQHYYYIDSAEINGYSMSFDISKTINNQVYLYKKGEIQTIVQDDNLSFISIFDYCRFIENILIYGKKEYSGRYTISSFTEQYFPFEFIAYDSYNTIVDDILVNWSSIKHIKDSKKCEICDSKLLKAHKNPDFLYCSECFYIERKVKNTTGNYDDIFMNTFNDYYLMDYSEYFLEIQNILLITPWELTKDQKSFFELFLQTLSKNENIRISFSSIKEVKNIYSLFDVVLIPYGIDMITNPCEFFENIGNKLFDNGRIILQTPNTLSFVENYNLNVDRNSNIFFNTSCMKTLCKKTGLKLFKSFYSSNDNNICLFICHKDTSSIPDQLIDTLLYELEMDIYDENSY